MTAKKFTAFALAGVATLGIAVVAPLSISAQATSGDSTTFIQQLAAKLGLSEAKVQSAVTEVREANQAERQAEREQAIATALSEGKLTQRQVDILEAMEKYREENRPELAERKENMQDLREELKDLSADERKARIEEQREAKQQELIAALNESGLNVTAEELESLRETMRDLDLGGHKGRRGPGGFGRGL